MENAFLYFLGLAIAFIIGVLITRWIFGIDKIIDNLKEQTNNLKEQTKLSLIQVRLLTRLCEKSGVTNEEINIVLKAAGFNEFKNEEERKSDYDFRSEAAKIKEQENNKNK